MSESIEAITRRMRAIDRRIAEILDEEGCGYLALVCLDIDEATPPPCLALIPKRGAAPRMRTGVMIGLLNSTLGEIARAGVELHGEAARAAILSGALHPITVVTPPPQPPQETDPP